MVVVVVIILCAQSRLGQCWWSWGHAREAQHRRALLCERNRLVPLASEISDWDQIVVHVVPDTPGAPLSRIADPMVAPYMWYWKEMPYTNAPPPKVFARSKFLLYC